MFHFSITRYSLLNMTNPRQKPYPKFRKTGIQIKEEKSNGIIQKGGQGHLQNYNNAPDIKDK